MVLAIAATPLPALAGVTGVVRGTVTLDGRLAAADVTLAGEGTSQAMRSDAAGRFAFERIPFGHYTLTATAGGAIVAQAAVDVTTDSVTDVALAGGGRVIGRTTASTRGVGGNPVSVTTFGGAEIAAQPQGQSLNRLIETVPGVAQFSYDEPVAHGFHGVTYEVDGAPVPSTSSANFSEVIDPRTIDSLEVFTGAFPAEFGGQRQGAVVNILTKRDVDIPNGAQSGFSLGFGSYGTSQAGFTQALRLGSTDVFLNAGVRRTNRGLDTPTKTPLNDAASLSDVFLRTITRLSDRDTLAFDYSDQYNSYQIPINLTATGVDSIVNAPGQNDVQGEYSRFGSLNFTHASADGAGYVQLIPWFRTNRIVYAGDLANDVLASDYSDDDCAPNPAPCQILAGLAQDRRATTFGLRAAYERSIGPHTFKAGLEGSAENFASAETIVTPGNPPFYDNVAQHGTAYAGYVQDKWTPGAAFSLQAGVRYDVSTGFVAGNLIQPRIGANLRVAPQTILHLYYGRLYAAPSLEDTRLDAIVAGGGVPGGPLPVYDLKPQSESYYEAGIARPLGAAVDASLNVWERNAWNVLDTTQVFPTPIFAVYNNALGLAHGFELHLTGRAPHATWYLSGTYAQSVAGGISGGTFLFTPDAIADTSLQPEDHDQTVAVKDGYTRRFGPRDAFFATLGTDYGTGYPVQFQNGTGRLTPHLTVDAAFGRQAPAGGVGWTLSVLNAGGYQYLIKVNNGFNTTQWSPGAQVLFSINAKT
jgi:outer membrane receptor protein involved in Fe transport